MIKPGTDVPRERSVQSVYLDELGREQPNPTPMQPPIGYVKHPTIQEQMRRMIMQASFEAEQRGAETEEEANDFDVGDDAFDHEFDSPHIHEFEPDPHMEAMIALQSLPPVPKDTQQGGEAAPAKPPVEPSQVPPPAAK